MDELSPNTDDPSLIAATAMREALQGGKAHYIALGDRHSVTEISGTDGRAYYSGTPVLNGLRRDWSERCAPRPYAVGRPGGLTVGASRPDTPRGGLSGRRLAPADPK